MNKSCLSKILKPRDIFEGLTNFILVFYQIGDDFSVVFYFRFYRIIKFISAT